MQMAVIEFARNVLMLKNANSSEMDSSTKNPVISLMDDQHEIKDKGGTMRLGSWNCKINKDSLAYKIYNKETISERHRHRYELNFNYMKKLSENGMSLSGLNPKTGLVEIVEIPDHDWFLGVQFHPEYQSTVENPHPIFVSFVKACVNKTKK